MAQENLLRVFAILPNGTKEPYKKIEPSPDRNRLEAQAQRLSQNAKGIRYEVNSAL